METKTKQKTIRNVFRVVSIIMMVVSVIFICIMLLQQVLLGGMSMFDASQVTYQSSDVAAVEQVHNFMIIHALGLFAGFGMMFVAGLFGAKYAAYPEKALRCVIIAAISIVCFIGALVFYETMYTPLFNKYDIYPTSGVATIIPIVAALLVYIVLARVNKARFKKDTTKIVH